ncbi:MAG: hypothetical protein AAGK14_10540 [Verrucomicrobiota bacterium]
MKSTDPQAKASLPPKRRLVRKRGPQANAAAPESPSEAPHVGQEAEPVRETREFVAQAATPPTAEPEPLPPTQPSAPASAAEPPAASEAPPVSSSPKPTSPTAAAPSPEPQTEDTAMKPPTKAEPKSATRNTGGWMGLSPQTTKPRQRAPEGKARNVNDFRANAARQAKEQKATGSILTWVGYSLGGGLLLVTVLAALGGYTLLRMIESQAVTVAELDGKYAAMVTDIRAGIEARNQAAAVEIAELRAINAKQRQALAVTNGQLESTQQELIDTQGELAELQKYVKTEAGRRYRGDINNNAKINRVLSRVRKLEND